MKIKKILMTAFAASMIFSLSACPTNNDANCSKEGTLSITKNQEIFEVGARIDLDKYVKISGYCGPKTYTASLAKGSELICQIRDHTLILLDEGDFKVRITAGPEGSQSTVNFIGKAYSPLRKKFYDESKNISDRFAFYGLEQLGEDSYKLTEQVYHNPNYYFECRNTSSGQKGIGYVKFPLTGRAYSFECNDFAGETFEWTGRDFEFDNRTVMNPWRLKIEDLTSEVDARAVDYLCLSSEVLPTNSNYFNNYAQEFAYNAMGVQLPESSGYDIDSIHIYCDTIEKVNTFYFDLLVKKAHTNPELYGRYKLLYGTSASCSWLDKIIQDGDEPEQIDTSDLMDKIMHLNNASNYTIEFKQWWEDTDGETVDLSLSDIPRVRSVYSHVPNANETGKFDIVNMKCLSEVESQGKFDGAIRGYTLKDDITYMIDNNQPDDTEHPFGDLVAHKQEGIDILDVMNKYSLRALKTGEGTLMADFDAISKDTSGSNVSYGFRGTGKNGNIIFNAIGMFQTLGYLYNHLWSQMITKNSYQFFKCDFSFGATLPLELTGTLQHDFEDGEGNTVSYIYNFEITVSDVNSTVVDLSAVTFETDTSVSV